MYRRYVTKPVGYSDEKVIDDVTMFRNMSKIWTAVTSLIFDLGRRSKAQNVGNWTFYSNSILNFRWRVWQKSAVGPQNFISFSKKIQFSIYPQFCIIYGKTTCKLSMKSYFHNDNVTNYIIAWLQSSIFMFKWNCHILRVNSGTIWDIITKCFMQVCREYLTIPDDIIDNDINDESSWPWNNHGCNSVNICSINTKQELRCRAS